ncbi:MAG: hypothetical protein IH906_06205 [Proteobacteria bacterium]|nr:hypothetical protein [Pseudomonadota bacterium]
MSGDARARILATIRDSLGADAPGRDESAVEARLAAHEPNLSPREVLQLDAYMFEKVID